MEKRCTKITRQKEKNSFIVIVLTDDAYIFIWCRSIIYRMNQMILAVAFTSNMICQQAKSYTQMRYGLQRIDSDYNRTGDGEPFYRII